MSSSQTTARWWEIMSSIAGTDIVRVCESSEVEDLLGCGYTCIRGSGRYGARECDRVHIRWQRIHIFISIL